MLLQFLVDPVYCVEITHSIVIVGIPFLCLRAFSLVVKERVRTSTWLMGRLERFLPVIVEFCRLRIGLKENRRSFADQWLWRGRWVRCSGELNLCWDYWMDFLHQSKALLRCRHVQSFPSASESRALCHFSAQNVTGCFRLRLWGPRWCILKWHAPRFVVWFHLHRLVWHHGSCLRGSVYRRCMVAEHLCLLFQI